MARTDKAPKLAQTSAVVGAPPSAPAAEPPVALVELLRIEGEARSAASLADLAILIANEARKVTRAQQTFVLIKTANGSMTVQAVTGLPVVDRTVPLVQCVERTVSRLAAQAGLEAVRDFKFAAYSAADDTTAHSYPLPHVMWFPIKYRSGSAVAGALMTRGDPWTANDRAIIERLGLTFSQAWYWLATSRSAMSLTSVAPKRLTLALLVLAIALGAIPVPMTTLAPLVLAPRNQVVVTAPLDGVIEAIPVEANAPVEPGRVLIKFNDIALKNRLAIAERDVDVAQARSKKSSLLAVTDPAGRHEMAIDRAELAVKMAERDYAADLLARATLRADQSGIVIVGDKRDLIGKPVSVGEKVLELADPDAVELHIDVPVGDAMILKPGASVRAFLDSDPLHAVAAHVVHADYQARPQDSGTLAFRVVASLDASDAQHPRLGTRGTAQLVGESVPLAYFLFRRPIASLRQWTGL